MKYKQRDTTRITMFNDFHHVIMRNIDGENYKAQRNIEKFLKEKKECNYEIIHKKVIAEIEIYHGIGHYKIYSLLLELFYGNHALVKDFMISKYGGFTKTEVSRTKSQYMFYTRQMNELELCLN